MEVVNTVGRRKAAVARVFVKPGKGQITINHKSLEDYFSLEILRYEVKQPMLVTETEGQFDVTINLMVVVSRVRQRQLVWVLPALCARLTLSTVRY